MKALKNVSLPLSFLLPWILAGLVLFIALTGYPPVSRNNDDIQIRVTSQSGALPDGFFVYQRLNERGIHIKSITPDHNSLLIRFDTPEQSLAAEQVLRQLFPDGFNIGQRDSLAPTNSWTNPLTRHT